MMQIGTLSLGAILATAAFLTAGGPVQAQRGVEFMNSPGYQRALIESRRKRLEASQATGHEAPKAKQPRSSVRRHRVR